MSSIGRFAAVGVALLALGAGTAFGQGEAAPPAADWATIALIRFDELPLRNATDVDVRVEAEGVALAEGRFGQAADFSQGGNARFFLPLDAQPDRELTLECWVYPREAGEERLRRIAGRSGGYGFHVTSPARRPMLTFFLSSGEGREAWKSIRAPLPVEEWTHIAGTYDGQTMILYVNGQEAGREENPGAVRPGAGAFFLGTEATRDENRFPGLIDELRISKIARTEFMTGRPAERPKPTAELAPVAAEAETFLRSMVVGRPSRRRVRIDGNVNKPVWQEVPPANFVKTMDATPPALPTEVRALYDDRFLYLAFRALERGQETHRHGPEGRDARDIYLFDGVEVMLQPGGPGAPYYQFIANPVGGVADILHPGDGGPGDWAWDSPGLQTAGVVGPDDWTIEMAIPFADLGVLPPQPGDEWRANFCRAERPSGELSAWAMTGGGFHVTDRFGLLTFGMRPEEAVKGGAHQVSGYVLEEDGTPVSGAPVRTPFGLFRTDATGEYRLRDVPPGDLLVQIASPRYETYTGRTTVRLPSEVLPPSVLKRVDPYLPAFGGPIGDGPVGWLKSSIVEPPDMASRPAEGDMATGWALLATPGEFLTDAVAFFTNEDLAAPEASISFSDGPIRIPAEAIDVRWTQRLLKRVQYRRVREDAVLTWRFLWREPPGAMPAGRLRQIVATVRVPDDAPAGTYRGELVLADSGRRVAALPVSLRVANFRLARSEKRVGVYYGIRGTSDEQMEIELADIAEHGGTLLVWHANVRYVRNDDGTVEYDVSGVRDIVEMQRRHGIGPPIIVGTRPQQAAALAGVPFENTPESAEALLASADFRRIYAGAVRALDALQEEMGAEFLYAWMDEVFGRGRFDTWRAVAEITKETTGTRIYITLHNRSQEMMDRAAPWVDVRCYHGHTLDWWQGQGHTWEELKEELETAGDEAWTYYNIRDITVTSEYARLCNGYWLWRSPLAAHVPWKYYSYGGSPFDDLDSDRHDFAYAAPHPDKLEMVSTLEWECFREGYDDLRYLATLEQAIERAAAVAPNHTAVRDARALRERYWNLESRVPQMAEILTAADYAQRREEMVEAVEALMRVR